MTLPTETKPSSPNPPSPTPAVLMIPEPCSKCLKPPTLCICDEIVALETKLQVLILQHPQEPDKDLGTARITQLALPNSVLKIGLSWRNLSAVLGREADPKRWAVLHLGSGLKTPSPHEPGIHLVDKKSAPVPEEKKILRSLEGIVILDGTWSQAKTLWWRNAWLLKLRRAILVPNANSLYKELRREPRKECLSTIESVAQSLTFLNEPPQTSAGLLKLFQSLLEKQRARLKARKR